jgi:hypothetical protein
MKSNSERAFRRRLWLTFGAVGSNSRKFNLIQFSAFALRVAFLAPNSRVDFKRKIERKEKKEGRSYF